MSLPIIEQYGDQIVVTYYLYTPSDVAAYAFLGLFALATVAHTGFMLLYKSWHFIPLIIGVILEVFAYYGRGWAHSEPDSIKPWVLSTMLMFIAPVFLAATLYMALCRFVVAIDAAEYSMMSPNWLVKLYILVDILVFISQLAGIGVQATGDQKIMNIGQNVVAAGLGFQLAMLVLFGFVAMKVARRLKKAAQASDSEHKLNVYKKATGYFLTFYITTAAVCLRSLVRLIEFCQGPTGTISRYEAFQYVFDAAPMFIFVAAFLIKHPGRVAAQSAARSSLMYTLTADARSEKA